MRTFRFMPACVLLLAGSSMAGSVDSGLPGIGTFAYGGPPVVASASPGMVVAVNEK